MLWAALRLSRGTCLLAELPMDPPRIPDKTYSEVMNEWAAQRHFVQANRSRLLHPPYDAHPAMKVLGYLGRVGVVLLLPLMVYGYLVYKHMRSPEFNKMISQGLATSLHAEEVKTRQARYSINGVLGMKALVAKGGPEAVYDRLEARNMGTRLPLTSVFRREWVLGRVSVDDLSVSLRSGGVGTVPLYELKGDEDEEDVLLPSLPKGAPRTGAVARREAPVLRAGLGISPDFAALRINGLQVARLHLTWGSGPTTAGGVTGMQTDLARGAGGWTMSGSGGEFRQGWLEGLKVDRLAATVGADRLVIEEARFSRAGGGKLRLVGSMTLGEMPLLEAELGLVGVPVQDLVETSLGGLFTAEAAGSLRLSGSVNRSAGIRMEGSLDLSAGRVIGLPLLKALHQLTGEDQFRQLSLRSGTVEFFTEGSPEHGGQIVEIKKLEVDCGPLARIRGTYRQEQQRGTLTANGALSSERLQVSGQFQLGVPAQVTAHFKPGVAARFFKPGADGWVWVDLPVKGPVNRSFTEEVAAELLQANQEAP